MCVLELDERRHAEHDVLGYPGENGSRYHVAETCRQHQITLDGSLHSCSLPQVFQKYDRWILGEDFCTIVMILYDFMAV